LDQPEAVPTATPVLVDQVEDSELDRLVSEGVPLEIAEVFTRLDRLGTYYCVPIIADDNGIEKRCPRVENRIPSETEIGERYGAVKFCLEFEYRPSRWKKGLERKRSPWLQLSDEYDELHQAYQNKRLLRMEDTERKNTLLRQARSGQGAQQYSGFSMKDVIDALPAIAAVVAALRPPPPPPPPPVPDNTALMLGLFKIMEASITNGGSQSGLVMQQMLEMSRKDKEQMMMFLTHNNQSKDESSGRIMEKVIDMVRATKEVKAAARELAEDGEVENEKPSIVEQLIKGAGVLLENLPMLMGMPLQTQQMMVNAALPAKHPEAAQVVQQARQDAELRAQAIPGLIKAYGCAQAREAMLVASIPFTEDELKEVCPLVGQEYAPPSPST
jgi:hypothetical protein